MFFVGSVGFLVCHFQAVDSIFSLWSRIGGVVKGTPSGLGGWIPTFVTVVGVATALSTSGSFFHAIGVGASISVDNVKRVVVKSVISIPNVVGIDVQTCDETAGIRCRTGDISETGEISVKGICVLRVVCLVSHDVVWSSSDLVNHISVNSWPALSTSLDEEVLVFLHVTCLGLLATTLEGDEVTELPSLLDEAGTG